MKAAVYHEAGGPDVLRYADVADPRVSSRQVLIGVDAIGVQGGDTVQRSTVDPTNGAHIGGSQCAGTILEVGDAVTDFGVGDRVVSVGADGAYAQMRAVAAVACWNVPDTVSSDAAACIPIEFGTAHDCLFEFGRLRAGETVLIHAGAGGVGLAAIQMAKRAGATVIATASSDERLDRLRRFGMDHGVNHAEVACDEAVDELTAGRGVDVVLDAVGGVVTQQSLGCLGYRGRCVSFGDAGRDGTAPVDVSTMKHSNQTLVAYFLGTELGRGRRAHTMIADRIADVAAGHLDVVIDRNWPLAEAGAAHRYIESRQAFGRVVLNP